MDQFSSHILEHFATRIQTTLCEAGLASVPVSAVTSLEVLDRLKKSIWSALWAIHGRRRDGERLPPEYWFWPP